jgi:hypothetical protein
VSTDYEDLADLYALGIMLANGARLARGGVVCLELSVELAGAMSNRLRWVCEDLGLVPRDAEGVPAVRPVLPAALPPPELRPPRWIGPRKGRTP